MRVKTNIAMPENGKLLDAVGNAMLVACFNKKV